MKNILKIYLPLAVIGVAALGGGVWFWHANEAARHAAAQEAEKAKAETDAFRTAIDSAMKQMVETLKQKTLAYRVQRKAADELLRVDGLKDASYARENLELFKDLEVKLRDQMTSILKGFDETEKTVRDLAAARPPEQRAEALAAWSKIKSEQFSRFNTYFATEGDILAAQAQLLDLYATRPFEFVNDSAGARIVMVNQGDVRAQSILTDAIAALEKKQDSLFQ